MKKILSLFVFTLALIWTWNIIHSSAAIGFETHAGIQQKLAELIKATLLSKKPTAQNLEITKLWTEPLGDNKVRAVFAYKFSEPGTTESPDNTEQSIEGEAILHREITTDNKTDKWSLQSVHTTNGALSFSEGSVVMPGITETEAEAAEPSAPAAPTEPANK
jgi:hypothetical protein